MHTVCETHNFRRDAAAAGMADIEVDTLIEYLAAHPDAGDEMPGTGGCRKLRVAGRGKGKSGGYRIITFFTGDNIPIFLITIFAKGERTNLSKAERNQLGTMTKAIVAEYRARVVKVSGRQ